MRNISQNPYLDCLGPKIFLGEHAPDPPRIRPTHSFKPSYATDCGIFQVSNKGTALSSSTAFNHYFKCAQISYCVNMIVSFGNNLHKGGGALCENWLINGTSVL